MNPDIAVAAAMMTGRYKDKDGWTWERDAALNMWSWADPNGGIIYRGHAAMERAIREENP